MNSLRSAAILLFFSVATHLALAATTPLSADQASALKAVRDNALEYTQALPNFICTQITLRESSLVAHANIEITGRDLHRAGPGSGDSVDVVEERLTYFDRQEHYDVIARNGRKVAGIQHLELAGAVSAGEFGSALHQIFSPESHTVFAWERMAGLRGRRVNVFSFQVPKEAGARVFDRESGKEITAPYSGSVFADPDTKDVLRITAHLDLPRDFPVVLVERNVDYKPTDIAGKSYNLPFHSEVRMQEGDYLFVNRITFKAYEKFTVESTIRYGNVAVAPTPEVRANEAAATQSSAMPSTQIEPVTEEITRRTTTVEPQLPPVAPTEKQIASAVPAQPAPTMAEDKRIAIAAAAESAAAPEQTRPVNAESVDASFHLQVRVDLVEVPVVVRDLKGQAVGNLTQEDFQIFDKGKRQEISSFTVETGGPPTAGKEAVGSTPDAARKNAEQGNAPSSFVAYLFDDVHLKLEDLAHVREAAARHIETLGATDRAAILTTSGTVQLQFTNDRGKLNEALRDLRAHPLGTQGEQKCPEVSFYMADLMLNHYNYSDLATNPPLQVATTETMMCQNLPASAESFAMNQALNAARKAEAAGEGESRGALLALKDAVRSLSTAPGRRIILLVSPGFVLNSRLRFDESAVFDQAIQGRVVISSLDARGLYALHPAAAVEDRSVNSRVTLVKAGFAHDEAAASSGVLEEMAAGTGGTLVQNTNDFYGGLERLATLPEFTYRIGFKPASLKLDGSYHPLKVKLNRREKLNAQARTGYFAAKQ